MVVDLALVVAVTLCLACSSWLANDLLWDRWEQEADRVEARRLTWLIVLNIVGNVIGSIGLLLLALRTSVW